MNDNIRVDSFSLKRRPLSIYRVRQPGTATVLWTTRNGLVRYLQSIQSERLQAKRNGR